MLEQRKKNKIELYMISQNINSETINVLLDCIKGKLNTDKTKKTPQKNPSGFLIKDPKTQQIFLTCSKYVLSTHHGVQLYPYGMQNLDECGNHKTIPRK